jgi:penicillin-binding protein 1A
MTGAFSSFANKGVYIEPILFTRIEDKNGNTIVRW